MNANISRELCELRAALADCRGERVAEPRVIAALLAHLLVSRHQLLLSVVLTDRSRSQQRPPIRCPHGGVVMERVPVGVRDITPEPG